MASHAALYEGSAVQSKPLGQCCDGIVPKNLALMNFITNYVLNNLTNSIGISFEKAEKERECTINQMCTRTSDRLASRLKSKMLLKTSCIKSLMI